MQLTSNTSIPKKLSKEEIEKIYAKYTKDFKEYFIGKKEKEEKKKEEEKKK